MPPQNLFTSAEEYSATLAQEVIHVTGHQKRLARESILEAAPFGSAIYTFEELLAQPIFSPKPDPRHRSMEESG
jgi:antirestriction protein ArdC